MGSWGSGPRRGGSPVLIALAMLAAGAVARAESAVAVVTASGKTGPVEAARAVQRVLDEQGGAALGDASVLARLQSVIRPEPPEPRNAAAELARNQDQVLEAVAFGRDVDAIALGDAVLEREGRRLWWTNTNEPAARALGNLCLFLVRAHIHRQDATTALERARECLRLVPDLVPSEELHPLEVRTALDQVRNEAGGRLQLEAVVPDGGACSARLQGRRALSLPAEIQLTPGTYDVHLECVRSRWHHHAEVKAGKTTRLVLVPGLEGELRVEPILSLARLHHRELAVLFEWLRIQDLWTVEGEASKLTITRYARRGLAVTVHGSRLLSTEPASGLDARLAQAVKELSCPGADCSGRAGPAIANALGIFGAGAGATAMGVSWVAYVRYTSLDGRFVHTDVNDASIAELSDSRETWRTAALATSLAGSAAFTAAAPLWLPQRRGMPWWGWASGVAGVTAMGLGAAHWVVAHGEKEATTCETQSCFRYRTGVPLGPLLLSQGVALLSLPVTYLVRGMLRSNSGALEVSAASGEVGVAWTQVGF